MATPADWELRTMPGTEAWPSARMSIGLPDIHPAQFAEFIKHAHREICLWIAEQAFWKIVDFTPVDTGALRGNWKGSTGRPIVRFNFDFKGGGPQHRPPRPDFIKRLFPTYEIVNAAPYGYEIEFQGKSSRKAPHGMVRKGMLSVMSGPVTLQGIIDDRNMAPSWAQTGSPLGGGFMP